MVVAYKITKNPRLPDALYNVPPRAFYDTDEAEGLHRQSWWPERSIGLVLFAHRAQHLSASPHEHGETE